MAVSLKKGQKVSLTKNNPKLKNIIVGLGWDTKKYDGQKDFDLDATAFLLNKNGKVNNSDDMIFYNQNRNVNGSVVHSGDNRTGYGEGDDESINISLDKVPNNIDKMSFVITIHEADLKDQNFGQVANAYVRVIDKDTNKELVRYDLGEDYSIETALVTGQLYRHNNEWKFQAVGSGYQKGLDAMCKDYGVDVEEPSHPQPSAPSAPTAPAYNDNGYDRNNGSNQYSNSNQHNNGYNQSNNGYYQPQTLPYTPSYNMKLGGLNNSKFTPTRNNTNKSKLAETLKAVNKTQLTYKSKIVMPKNTISNSRIAEAKSVANKMLDGQKTHDNISPIKFG